MSFRPGADCWSRLEVIDHVVKVEESILREAWSNVNRGVLVGMANRIRVVMVLAVMRSPMRIKVPAGAEMAIPGSETNFPELVERWVMAREDLQRLLDSARPERRMCGVFVHPVSGWMTVGQMVAFLSAHLRHHVYQLDRLNAFGEN